ncbi:MAG: hypothetical protein C0625_01990 [Arcobacter sp.]|nr:MAG: hypothetical protein C0625_01990 [Arcobacter sp.]
MSDIDYAQAYFMETGDVAIEGDEQKIEVSEETARKLAVRLCRIFGWGIRPSESVNIGFLGKANENCTKENPIGK